ncbi:MAG: pseudouridine synthase [Myxococcota bacterium]|nr:pseudouridine synthase [Myxococcota bacterium]
MSEIRLAKLLAARGIASRREAENMIREGRLSVNGQRVEHPGTAADPERDAIRLDGKPLPDEPPRVYFMLNKPRGVLTTRKDPEGRESIEEYLEQIPHRVEPVGRLDFDTAGVLLLTNDGELAHQLTHPSGEIPKRYMVKVWKAPSAKALERLEKGVHLDDGKTAPAKVRIRELTDQGNAWMEVTVTEGRNRLIRRMFEAVGHPVSKLRRESFATIGLSGLDRGEVRPLTGAEVQRLRDLAEGRNPNRQNKRRVKKGKGFAVAKNKKRKVPKRKKHKKKVDPGRSTR